MNEPTTPTTPYTAYVAWARENKKRADRLLAAVKSIFRDGCGYKNDDLWIELGNAVTDYENKIG